MARKGWDLLSEKYRNRLIRSGITQSDYTSGVPLHGARGHVSVREESFKRQIRRFARDFAAQYRDSWSEVSEVQIRNNIRRLGIEEGRKYMTQARTMNRLWMQGDTEAAHNLWLVRNKTLPVYMNYYHGIFA